MPKYPIIQVARPSGTGSGAFIAPDLVLTAGHVVRRRGGPPFPVSTLRVVLPGGPSLPVKAQLCLDGWNDRGDLTQDMAILRVASPQPSLVIGFALDRSPQRQRVEVMGFLEGVRAGKVSRATDPDEEGEILRSSDLTFHDGVSGAPIFGDDGKALGIVTATPDSPTPDAFIGLPLLTETLGSLLQKLS
ncbi:MAG TPA: serine protease [Kofleriaceae bacterium]|nr:serine protease [Kofleriaceae bacterium]